MNHAMSTDSKQVLVITGFVFRLCQSARVCSAYCWLLSGLTLPCRSKHCLVPLRSSGFCSFACSLIETAAWELCGVSPPQSFQLRTVCSRGSLSRVCTCAESQAAGVSPASTLPKHARLQGMLRGRSLRCETSAVVRVVTHSDSVSLHSALLEWLCKLFFCYVSDLTIEADVIHGVLWPRWLECIKRKSFAAFKSLFSRGYKVRWRNSHLSPACSSPGFT